MAIFGRNRATLGRSKGAVSKRLRSFPTRISITRSGVTQKLRVDSDFISNDYISYTNDAGTYSFDCYFGSDGPYATVYAGATDYFFPSPLTLPALTTIPLTGWANGITFAVITPTIVSLSMAANLSAVYTGDFPSFKTSVTSTPAGPASSSYSEYNLSAYEVGIGTGTISINNSTYDGAPINFSYTITRKPVTLSLFTSGVSYGSSQLPVSSSANSVYASSSAFHTFNDGGIGSNGITNFLTGYPTRSSLPGTYTISFNPSYVSKNYSISNTPASASYTVLKLSQGISFYPSSFANFGTTQTLSASATSSLPVSFSIVSGPGTITNGNILSYTGAGSVVVRASQGGSSIYNPATNVDATITVSVPVDTGIPQRLGILIESPTIVSSTVARANSAQVGSSAAQTFALKSGETGTKYSYNSAPVSGYSNRAYVFLNPKHEIKNSSTTVYSSPGYWVFGIFDSSTFTVLSTNTGTNAESFPTSNWTNGLIAAPQYPKDITVSGSFAHINDTSRALYYTGTAPSPRTLKNRSYIPSSFNEDNSREIIFNCKKFKNIYRNLFTNFEIENAADPFGTGATQNLMFTPTGFLDVGTNYNKIYLWNELKPYPGLDKWTFFSTASYSGDNSGYYNTSYLVAKSASQSEMVMPSSAIADFESYRAYPGYETSLSAPISFNYSNDVLPNILIVSGGYYDSAPQSEYAAFGAIVNGDVFTWTYDTSLTITSGIAYLGTNALILSPGTVVTGKNIFDGGTYTAYAQPFDKWSLAYFSWESDYGSFSINSTFEAAGYGTLQPPTGLWQNINVATDRVSVSIESFQ
jgi:hypothetical protein